MNISDLYRIKAFRSLIQSAEHIKLNTDVSKTKYRMLKDMFDTLIYGSKTNLSIEKYKFHGSNRRFTEYDNKRKLLYHSQIRKQIANKTLKGTRLKLPLGYSQDQDGIIKIDSNAFVVHLIFQVFMNTKSIAAIRDKLFKFNFPLNEDKIKGILTKSFYSGVIEIDDERFPCDHFIEPIISRSDFASIQDIFAIRRSRVSESAITNFPLSAFVEDVSTHKNYIGDADLTSAGPPKQI